jgi:hypothetical protein
LSRLATIGVLEEPTEIGFNFSQALDLAVLSAKEWS